MEFKCKKESIKYFSNETYYERTLAFSIRYSINNNRKVKKINTSFTCHKNTVLIPNNNLENPTHFTDIQTFLDHIHSQNIGTVNFQSFDTYDLFL